MLVHFGLGLVALGLGLIALGLGLGLGLDLVASASPRSRILLASLTSLTIILSDLFLYSSSCDYRFLLITFTRRYYDP